MCKNVDNINSSEKANVKVYIQYNGHNTSTLEKL